MALDDNDIIEFVPWEESIISSFNINDEVIIVYGGNKRQDKKNIVLNRLKELQKKYNIKIVKFKWSKEFNWTQFSKSYAYGKSFAKTKWIMFYTYDEVFPKSISKIRTIVRFLPSFIDYISLIRAFLISKEKATVYIFKRMILRNKPEITFGMISHKQGPRSNYKDFGRPVNITKWYDGKQFVLINKNLSTQEKIFEKVKKGVLLKGFRDMRWYKTLFLPLYFINTHVFFMPMNKIIEQQQRSNKAYHTLPKNHIEMMPLDPKVITKKYEEKIKFQLRRRPTIKVNVPSILKNQIDKKYKFNSFILKIIRDNTKKKK